jgi:CheY-like chemotaxis protein
LPPPSRFDPRPAAQSCSGGRRFDNDAPHRAYGFSGDGLPLEVTETDQGMRALEKARDIVFLDYNMPGFSGLRTIAEFRRELGAR